MNTKLAYGQGTLVLCLLAFSCIWAGFNVSAQIQTQTTTNLSTPGDYVCVQRSPHSRVWQRAVLQTNQSGVVSTNLQSYTEIATGLCYIDPNTGEYIDSVEQIDAVANGAQATQGRYQVQWSANANTPGGAVNLTTPDGKTLLSTVYGLIYYDSATGSNVLLTQLQDCTATIDSNRLTYANAFSNLTADVRYTYRKAGLSQDIVLRQQPPSPADYGLDPTTTQLEVLTEFFNAPAPDITTVTNNGLSDDCMLDFGDMKMGVGHAFLFQNDAATVGTAPVSKSWTNFDNRTFLIETVPYTSISNLLSSLHSSLIKPDKSRVRRTVSLEPPKPRKVSAIKSAQPIKVVKTVPKETALMLDYELLSSETNFTFQGDTTYYVSGALNLSGTNNFEGGAVIKYTNSASLNISYPAEVNFLGATYRPTVFTAKDDNSVGVPITNSTGTPSGYYANPAISYTGSTSGASYLTMNHFRISYAQEAISAGAIALNVQLNDGQIIDCYNVYACSAQGNATMQNMLFANFYTAFTLGIAGVAAQNATFYSDLPFSELVLPTGGTDSANASFVNCIIANVTEFSPPAPPMGHLLSGSHNGFYNSGATSVYWYTNTWFGTSPVTTTTNPFQTVGAGAFYLATNSTFTNAGTTNIPSSLLADLEAKTTHPPMTNFSGSSFGLLTNDYTFSPQALRDTNGSTVDFGYHYDPLDYTLYFSISNATATVLPGTALAAVESVGVYLYQAATFNCTGTATSPNYLVRYNTVQEQSNTNWEATYLGTFLAEEPSGPTNVADFDFTIWSTLGQGDHHLSFNGTDNLNLVSFRNCQFYNGRIESWCPTLLFTNCLFQRVKSYITDYGDNAPTSNFFGNNLFFGGEFEYEHDDIGTWTFRDNFCDQTYVTQDNQPYDVCSNNAYVTTNYGIALPSNDDKILSYAPAAGVDFLTGDLGDYYYATNGELASLIHAGSRSASAAALYHYTVTTNNVIEGTNTVSIGFHYVATDTNGVPLDSNGDGVPDYLEDANGDGIMDDGETNWALAILTQPLSQIVCQGSNATFTVVADGIAPLTYQWRFDGTNIGEATNSSLTLTNVSNLQSGNYSNMVSNAFGPVFSSNAVLTVVSVATLAPTNNTNCLLMSSNATLQVWGVPMSTNVGVTNLEIVATSSPYVSSNELPTGWSLDGVLTNITYVSITNPGDYTVICTAGTSAITNIIVVTSDGDLTNWHDGTLRWVCTLPRTTATNENGSGIDSSPAIGPDGTIYVTQTGNALYAINPNNGTIKWTNSDGAWTNGYDYAGGYVTSSPAIDSNGIIYFATETDGGNADTNTYQGYLYAVGANGITLWKNGLSGYGAVCSSPAIGAAGAVYVEQPNNLVSVNSSNGNTNWIYGDQYQTSSAVIGIDGTVYCLSQGFGSDGGDGGDGDEGVMPNGTFDAVSPEGLATWIYPMSFLGNSGPSESYLESSPALGFDGTFYCAANSPWLCVLNSNGTPKWVFDITDVDGITNGAFGDIQSCPAVDTSGTAYFGASDANFYAVTNGVLKWVFTNSAEMIISSPALSADGTVYVGSMDTNFYAITNGVLKWKFTNATGPILSSPAIAGDGTVYFGSEDGNLYAVYGSAPLDTNSPWPMFRRDPQHTASQSILPVSSNSPPTVPSLIGAEADVFYFSAYYPNPYSYSSSFSFSVWAPSNTSWDVFMSTDFVNWTNIGNISISSNPRYLFSYTTVGSTPSLTAFFYLSATNDGSYCSRIIGFTTAQITTGALLVDPFYEETPNWGGDSVFYPLNTLQAVVNNLNKDYLFYGLTIPPGPAVSVLDPDVGLQIEKSSASGSQTYTYQGISDNYGVPDFYRGVWQNESGGSSGGVMLLPGESVRVLSAGSIPQSCGLVGLTPPPGPTTNHIFVGTNYLSSMLPKAGYIGSDLNFTNASLNDQILLWDTNASALATYTCVNSVLQQWLPEEPYLNFAQGFILVTTNSWDWIQKIPFFPGASSSGCTYTSVTNCGGGSGSGLAVTPANSTNFPWALLGQTVQATATLTESAPGLLLHIVTNEECKVTITDLNSTNDLNTNWWQSTGPGTNSASGPGLTASFTPTSCGYGTLVFYLVYTNYGPCGGGLGATSVVCITNTFGILTADSLVPTNLSGATLLTSNSTCQTYAVVVTTNTPSSIDVVADSCPSISGPNFPSFWSLNGIQTNTAFVNTSVPGAYSVVYTLGTSSITNLYYILGSTNAGLNVWITEPVNYSALP